MSSHYKGDPGKLLALDTYIKLVRAQESVSSRLGRRMAEAGLTASQFAILEALYHLGPMCQRDLGGKLLKSSGNVTMVVDNLERQGLVQRERDAADRRYITVSLTAAGAAQIGRVFPGHAADVAALMSALTEEEQRTLGQLCKKLGLSAEAGRKHE